MSQRELFSEEVASTTQPEAKTKRCSKCKQVLPVGMFNKNTGKWDGLQTMCSPCHVSYAREYRKSGNGRLDCMRRAGVSIALDQLEALRDAQGDRCAICGENRTSLKRDLHIDHCHSSLLVRGLLCSRCNTMLGQYEKLSQLNALSRVEEYLRNPPANQVLYGNSSPSPESVTKDLQSQETVSALSIDSFLCQDML